jgi:hypothetical protein
MVFRSCPGLDFHEEKRVKKTGSLGSMAAPIAGGPGVVVAQRFGYNMRPTSLMLTLSEPLDPIRAQNVRNFTATITDKDLVFGPPHSVPEATALLHASATRIVPNGPAGLCHRGRSAR